MTASQPVPVDSLEVRSRLVDALKLDLVGPWAGHELGAEQLPGRERPSNWYVAGFLIPTGTAPDRSADADEDDDLDTVPESAGLAEESNDERKAARGVFPIVDRPELSRVRGVPRTGRHGALGRLRTGGYRGSGRQQDVRLVAHSAGGGAVDPARRQRGTGRARRPRLRRPADSRRRTPARGGGVDRDGSSRRHAFGVLLSRQPAQAGRGPADRAYAFQAEIEVRTDEGFVPRPDLRGAHGGDWDDRVADLHYADTPEYATGHGVSAEWEFVDGECRSIRTAWVGTAEVEKTATADVPGVELSMEALGRLDDGTATQQALGPLVVQYREWIEARRQEVAAGPGQCDRRDTAEQLLHYAGIAVERMARGVALLGEDADLLDAFRVANRAVARALRQRLGEKIGPDGPRWRPFQLAFLLLNLPGLADPHDVHRETVDLLFFPTGGGKTEAYLGLAAVAMVLRRLRHPGDDGLAGAGVSVIMRYTLRLLTLDQLARAAGLICALEIERTEAGGRYRTRSRNPEQWVFTPENRRTEPSRDPKSLQVAR